jgi:NAD(P)-dependent dehydrogenase (short-subunit alcohol dehydrogenase family)
MLSEALDQFFPPSPTFTESSLPSLTKKVIVITGGNAGIGFELAKILYSKGATVYIACRSETKARAAISIITSLPAPTYTFVPGGKLKFLPLELADLASVKAAAQSFLAQESRLDILYNNAAVNPVPVGSRTAQGHELRLGVNCLGHFLFTSLLLPALLRTAKLPSNPPGSVRIIFTSSGVIETSFCPPGGVCLTELTPHPPSENGMHNYAMSKAGDWYLVSEFSKRICQKAGIVSLAHSPGNLKTKGWDSAPWWIKYMMKPTLHPPRMGAVTGLWAGFSDEVGVDDAQRFAINWGRWQKSSRVDIVAGLKSEKEGGTGIAEKFWVWCEEQCKDFL